MSCETGSRSVAAGPAGGSGISALASKASHYAGKATGVAGGAAAGAIVGGGLGSLAGPAGTIAGAVAGGVAGGALGSKRYEKRQVALKEKQWRESVAGKNAAGRRDQTLSKLKLDYKEQTDRFNTQRESIGDELKQAKETWLAEKLPQASVKKKAVAGSLATSSLMMAVEYAAAGKVSGAGATGAALAAVATYPEQVQRLKNEQWKKSPEGKKAEGRYIKRMDNLKTRWRRAKEENTAQKAAAEVKYETARARALAR